MKGIVDLRNPGVFDAKVFIRPFGKKWRFIDRKMDPIITASLERMI